MQGLASDAWQPDDISLRSYRRFATQEQERLQETGCSAEVCPDVVAAGSGEAEGSPDSSALPRQRYTQALGDARSSASSSSPACLPLSCISLEEQPAPYTPRHWAVSGLWTGSSWELLPRLALTGSRERP